MTSFAGEVDSGLAERPLAFSGRLVSRGLASLVKGGHCNVLEPLIYTFLKCIWLIVFMWVYRFHSKSISFLNWCYRLSIHRGQMKSILNAIRQGEHGHFLQLMYELIIGILTSSYRPYRGCPLWDFGGNLPWCIGSALYLQNGVPLLVWIESVVVDTFVLWVNKRIWNVKSVSLSLPFFWLIVTIWKMQLIWGWSKRAQLSRKITF